MPHPYGIKLKPKQTTMAIAFARKRQRSVPETTCAHRTCCCMAGCPNMYYAEFLSIYDGIILKMGERDRIDLTVECVRRYLQAQSVERPKPCPFLKGSDCSIYRYRPLKCRLYGLVPNDLYQRIVAAVSQDMRVPADRLPLCVQCDQVKIKPEWAAKFPDGKVPEKTISMMEKELRQNDVMMGVPPKIQAKGFGFLTYHDWHVMLELGEGWMASLTPLREKMKDEEKEHLVEALKKALYAKLDSGD